MKVAFIALALLIAITGIQAQDGDSVNWWSTVTESLSCTQIAEDGSAVLRVELGKPEENQLEEIKDSDGVVTGYAMGGIKLPRRFWPGCTLISKFELEWDGKKINIPKRFWADIAGFRIQKSSLKVGDLPDNKKFEGERFLDSLDQPRIYISAGGQTVLIEWNRPEECDGRSTFRWIISRSGKILRHCHTPPHEC